MPPVHRQWVICLLTLSRRRTHAVEKHVPGIFEARNSFSRTSRFQLDLTKEWMEKYNVEQAPFVDKWSATWHHYILHLQPVHYYYAQDWFAQSNKTLYHLHSLSGVAEQEISASCGLHLALHWPQPVATHCLLLSAIKANIPPDSWTCLKVDPCMFLNTPLSKHKSRTRKKITEL